MATYGIRKPQFFHAFNINISVSSSIIESEFAAYQLGYHRLALTGDILMQAGLPVKFFTLDDSVMFVLKETSNRWESAEDI